MTARHEPTPETRRSVEALAGYGVRQEVIACSIGISIPTLLKHYRAEIDAGVSKAEGQIARAAFDKAVKDKDTAMIIWLTKTRLKWKDESKVIHHGGDPENPIRVEHSARDRIASRIARLAAAAGDEADD